jgi:hypothetical protein
MLATRALEINLSEDEVMDQLSAIRAIQESDSAARADAAFQLTISFTAPAIARVEADPSAKGKPSAMSDPPARADDSTPEK